MIPERSRKLLDAEGEVEAARQRIESVFDDFEEKVRFGSDKLRLLGDRIQAPRDYLRENPLPAALMVGLIGYLIGSKIQERFGSPWDRLDHERSSAGRVPAHPGDLVDQTIPPSRPAALDS